MFDAQKVTYDFANDYFFKGFKAAELTKVVAKSTSSLLRGNSLTSFACDFKIGFGLKTSEVD